MVTNYSQVENKVQVRFYVSGYINKSSGSHKVFYEHQHVAYVTVIIYLTKTEPKSRISVIKNLRIPFYCFHKN